QQALQVLVSVASLLWAIRLSWIQLKIRLSIGANSKLLVDITNRGRDNLDIRRIQIVLLNRWGGIKGVLYEYRLTEPISLRGHEFRQVKIPIAAVRAGLLPYGDVDKANVQALAVDTLENRYLSQDHLTLDVPRSSPVNMPPA